MNLADDDLRRRARAVRLLLTDVDGVLTDGALLYAADGSELKAFDVRDGLGAKLWRGVGGRLGIVTGRSSPAVARRAAELGTDWLRQGVETKWPVVAELLREAGATPEEVAYLGDDLPDVPFLRRVGLGIAPADAAPEARAAAAYTATKPGGRGVLREVVELLLRAQDRWREAIAPLLEGA